MGYKPLVASVAGLQRHDVVWSAAFQQARQSPDFGITCLNLQPPPDTRSENGYFGLTCITDRYVLNTYSPITELQRVTECLDFLTIEILQMSKLQLLQCTHLLHMNNQHRIDWEGLKIDLHKISKRAPLVIPFIIDNKQSFHGDWLKIRQHKIFQNIILRAYLRQCWCARFWTRLRFYCSGHIYPKE